MTSTPTTAFVYVTYIRTTPEKLWSALTDADFMRRYWFDMHIETDWKAGSLWRLVFPDGRLADAGEIVETEPPRRLVLKWRNEWKPELESRRLCALRVRYRGRSRSGETDRHPYDGAARLETHRSRLRRLAAHPLQPQVAPRDGRDCPEGEGIEGGARQTLPIGRFLPTNGDRSALSKPASLTNAQDICVWPYSIPQPVARHPRCVTTPVSRS